MKCHLKLHIDITLHYITSYDEWKAFIGKIHVQNRNIVGNNVRNLAYDIPERNFSTFQVTIVSRSYDKLTIIV